MTSPSDVLLRAHGLELVRLTADVDVNDDRDIYVIREQGDTADLWSDYDEEAARAQFAHECHVRRLAGRAA